MQHSYDRIGEDGRASQQVRTARASPSTTMRAPGGGAMEEPNRTHWNLLQLLVWICFRNPQLVEKAAHDATIRWADLDGETWSRDCRAVFYELPEAKRATVNEIRAGKLTMTGFRDCRGHREAVRSDDESEIVFRHPRRRPPYVAIRKNGTDTAKWVALQFRPDQAMQIWLPVPDEPTITFLQLAKAIRAIAGFHRIKDTVQRMLARALRGEITQGCLGWNAHEERKRGERDPNEFSRSTTREVPTHIERYDGTAPRRVISEESVRFEHVTPIAIVYLLADRGYGPAIDALRFGTAEACRRLADTPLPTKGTRARDFIYCLTMTESEAVRFCQHEGLPIPPSLAEVAARLAHATSGAAALPSSFGATEVNAADQQIEVNAPGNVREATTQETNAYSSRRGSTKRAASDGSRRMNARTRKYQPAVTWAVEWLIKSDQWEGNQDRKVELVQEAVNLALKRDSRFRGVNLPTTRQGLWLAIERAEEVICKKPATKLKSVAQQNRS